MNKYSSRHGDQIFVSMVVRIVQYQRLFRWCKGHGNLNGNPSIKFIEMTLISVFCVCSSSPIIILTGGKREIEIDGKRERERGKEWKIGCVK